jgi:adenylate cyclase
VSRAGLAELAGWITEAGLAGQSEAAILDGFCRRAIEADCPIARAGIVIDTLHPVLEGRAFRWRRDGAAAERTEVIEYGPSDEGEIAESWRRSVFFRMIETGQSLYRNRLAAGQSAEFPALVAWRDEGMTDYLALITRFAARGVIGEMDCVYSYWITDHPGGFDDGQVEALAGLMPMLGLAVKCVSLGRIAGTLVETYLGRDAGRRVLGGLIRRGVAETISAVLWYSDLREFTRITDHIAPQQIIALLNDYADAVISAVYDNGGDVLKLIGDGTLAIFTADTNVEACRGALAAHAAMRHRLDALNDRRAAERLPITEVYLGLHVGDVSYGNIGSKDRLDFTVIGRAVNEVSRIAAMCRSAERNVLVSAAFAAAAAEPDRTRLVSVGRYALRGVERPQELFTIDPLAAD